MDYEYQIISLPIGQARENKVMPVPGDEGISNYEWYAEAGASSVLMSFVRFGWEPAMVLGTSNGAISLLIRKRVATGGRGAH